MKVWRAFAATLADNAAVIDIGAYQGVYALAAREILAQAPVFAFEPNPSSFRMLATSTAGKRIETLPLAVAETSGTVQFLCESETSRIITGGPSTGTIEVPSVSLDDWLLENRVEPRLMKIDTEGQEAGILRGAKRTLTTYGPVILCEVLSDEAGLAVMAALPATYRFFRINEDIGIGERRRITRDNWRHKNWLLTPEHRVKDLWALLGRRRGRKD